VEELGQEEVDSGEWEGTVVFEVRWGWWNRRLTSLERGDEVREVLWRLVGQLSILRVGEFLQYGLDTEVEDWMRWDRSTGRSQGSLR